MFPSNELFLLFGNKGKGDDYYWRTRRMENCKGVANWMDLFESKSLIKMDFIYLLNYLLVIRR